MSETVIVLCKLMCPITSYYETFWTSFIPRFAHTAPIEVSESPAYASQRQLSPIMSNCSAKQIHTFRNLVTGKMH